MKEILQKLGYKIQSSSWDREDLSRMTIVVVPHEMFGGSVQMEYVINDQDVWQVYISTEKIEIVHAYKGNRSIGWLNMTNENPSYEKFMPIMEFERLFLGTIKDEGELLKILQQTGCPVNGVSLKNG